MTKTDKSCRDRKHQVRRDWTDLEKDERKLLARLKQQRLFEILELRLGEQLTPNVILLTPSS